MDFPPLDPCHPSQRQVFIFPYTSDCNRFPTIHSHIHSPCCFWSNPSKMKTPEIPLFDRLQWLLKTHNKFVARSLVGKIGSTSSDSPQHSLPHTYMLIQGSL